MEMKIIFVFVAVLELTCVCCLSLSRTEINNSTDVYKVTEDEITNSLRLVYPKAEKPTLREIVYYHIIETPYEQDQQSADSATSTEDDLNVPEEEPVLSNNTPGPSGPVEDDKTIDIDPRADINPGKESESEIADGDASEESSSDTAPVGTDVLLKSAADADNIKDMGWTDFIKDPEESTRRKREIGGSKILTGRYATNGNMNILEDQNINLEDEVDTIGPRVDRSTEKKAKTYYGMSLTGNSGLVWNKSNNKKTSYPVGVTYDDVKDKRVLRTNRDSEDIDAKIEKFEKELAKAASKEEPSVEETTKPPKTHGMSLTGDRGTVWNKSNEVKPALNMKTDYEDINKKIDKSERIMENEDSKEGPTAENPSVVEPMQPAKTYGMSLTGDRGTVWNDLNGSRVSYHVGVPANDTQEVTTENAVVETTTQLNLDNIPDNTPKPSDNDKENPKPDFPKGIEDALDEINKILDSISKENNKPGDDSNDSLVKEIVDKTKDVSINETTKLEDTAISNRTNETNSDKDTTSKDKDDDKVTMKEPTSSKNPDEIDDTKKDDEGEQKTSPLPNVLEDIMKNDQFWKWINDWSTTYLDLMMNRIDNHIKEEVGRQIAKYVSEKNNNDTIDSKINTSNLNNKTVRQNEGDISAKKRKDKDCEGQYEKYAPVKIEANTMYGNYVGNGNVTNIFIFNNNNKSNLDTIKPLVNGTHGIYVFGDDINQFDKEKDKDDKDDKENKTINNPIESLPNLDDPATVKNISKPNTVADHNASTTDISQEPGTELPENVDVKVNVDSTLPDSKENVKENTSVGNDTNDKDDNVDIDPRFGSDNSTQETEKNTDEKDISNKLPAEDSVKEVMDKSSVDDKNKTSLEEIDNNKKNTNTPREDKTDISNADAEKDNIENNKTKDDSDAVEATQSSSSIKVERVDKESSEDAPKNTESIMNLSVEVGNHNKAVTDIASKALNKINLL